VVSCRLSRACGERKKKEGSASSFLADLAWARRRERALPAGERLSEARCTVRSLYFNICLLFSLRSSIVSVIRAGVAINSRVKAAALRTASRAAS